MNKTRTKSGRSRLYRILLSAGLVVFFCGVSTTVLWGLNRHTSPISHATERSSPVPQPEAVQHSSQAAIAPAQPAPEPAPRPLQQEHSCDVLSLAAETTPAQLEALDDDIDGHAALDKPELETAAPHPEYTPTLSWEPLIKRLAADGYDVRELRRLFASLKIPPLPEFMGQKAVELYGRYGKASLALSDEDRNKFAPPDYSRIAGGMSVAAGRRTINANSSFFERLYKQYGVPAPFIVAVMMVETGLGAETGKQSALLALGSMASTDSLGDVQHIVSGIEKNEDAMEELIKARSDWAYDELKALIDYAQATGKDAASIPGSVYGAIGICQFMPSNIPRFGVSASKQRPTPDLFVLSDAAASVARYLSAHGWRKATTPAGQLAVLRSYNHSDVYASTVYGVASALMSPTTHASAESARKGGNAVTAARKSAQASIPSGSKKSKPMENLPSYSDLLE